MRIITELCDICGTCVSVCPADAIIVEEFQVSIDNARCIECGKCRQVCPARAIEGDVK
ncbi:MAG: 4Fe-4S binding protein [Candidatus Cloacimonetes bacterium]|nr:4Fe-4S binding protein [Candidatus Cloacimonadota bacterium]